MKQSEAFEKAFVPEPDAARQGSGVGCPLVAVVTLLVIAALVAVLL